MLWLIAIVLGGYFIFSRVWKAHKHWDNLGVVTTNSWPLFGDMAVVVFRKLPMAENVIKMYNNFPNERYFGMKQFTVPTLFIRDLDLVKQIGIKDFDHFEDHRVFISPDADPLFAKNLSALKGQQWRDMRATLSPAFTSAKMKSMFNLISECGEEFVQHFFKKGNETITLEMKETFTRFTNDVIASTAFGIKCDSLEDKENEFYLMGKDATNFTPYRAFVFFLYSMIPAVLKFFRVPLFSKKVSSFFRRIVKETIDTREKGGIIRPDMIHLLMEARKGKLKHELHPKGDEDAGFATVEESNIGVQEVKQRLELTDDDITAQALIFFFAGFDTTSTALSFMAHELAINPDIQKKLQQEVDATLAKGNGKLTYEALLKMKYLDMVMSETLRKWPPGFMTDRVCVKPYTIAPTKPHEKPVHLDVGDVIMLPCIAFHWDPQYFPNPEKFDPERFSDESKDSIVPGSYLPFGVGPRNCIGSRFALLENKTLFCHILAKFDIVTVEKTEIPLQLSKKQFNLLSDNGFWLGFRPRKL